MIKPLSKKKSKDETPKFEEEAEYMNGEFKFSNLARHRLSSYWYYVIIFGNMLHILATLNNLTPDMGVDQGQNMYQEGLATLLLWLALNRYLTPKQDYGFLPKTMIHSAYEVFNGLIGILPIVIGTAVILSVFLYQVFRFESITRAMFTMFYTI